MIDGLVDTPRGGWTILASFAVALVLTVVPMPEWAETYRPDWVGLVLIYWCMAAPQRVGTGTGWLLGLALDVIQASILGQHALAKSVLAYLAGRLHLRMRMFPWWQQMVMVLILLSIDKALLAASYWLLGDFVWDLNIWLPSLASAVLWPWLFVILRDVRRSGRVR